MIIKIRNLYLLPLEDDPDFVPILSLDCNLNERRANFRVDMYRLHNTVDNTVDNRLHCVGYRFEIGQADSKHDYHHVQFTNRRPQSEGGHPLPESPQWAPVQVPCIPVPATRVVALILCLVISFYGKRAPDHLLRNVLRGIDNDFIRVLWESVGLT